VDDEEASYEPTWTYRFLVVDVPAEAEAREQTEAINREWERIATEVWTPTIVSFQMLPAGDYVSIVILYRYDDYDDEADGGDG
jgi:hypothetical protein